MSVYVKGHIDFFLLCVLVGWARGGVHCLPFPPTKKPTLTSSTPTIDKNPRKCQNHALFIAIHVIMDSPSCIVFHVVCYVYNSIC